MRLSKNLVSILFIFFIFLIISLSIFTNHNEEKQIFTKNLNENNLMQRLIHIQQQLIKFDYINERRKQEIIYLKDLIKKYKSKNNLISTQNNINLNYSPADSLLNFNNLNNLNNNLVSQSLNLPSILNLLPHLNQSQSIEPAYVYRNKRRRQEVEIVFGIPTIEREKNSYLLQTVKSLIDNLDETGKNNSLFVIMISEFDLDYVRETSLKLEERFSSYIDDGLIEIISPPKSYYPNFDLINSDKDDPMDDPVNRIKWRTKQNLDYAYLMMYCKNRGYFYMQLEDDILAKPNYYSLIKNYVYKKIVQNKNWFVIEFSNLGFIGRLFRSTDLPIFITFFLIFHRDKPVDWLMNNVVNVKYCRNDGNLDFCKRKLHKHVISYRPPLFQHVGTISSMKGKIQKLKERGFDHLRNFVPHFDNPPCTIESNIISYKSKTIDNIYNGYSVFWGLKPNVNDYILFVFEQPILVEKYIFKSGSWDHPLYSFYNTTLSVLPVIRPSKKINATFPINKKGFYVVDEFNLSKNKLEGSLIDFGAIYSISLDVKSNLKNPVILSEIIIKPKLN